MTVRKLAMLAVSVAVLGCGFSASAEVLTPHARLRKLSLQTRGIVPTDAEYAQLTKLDGASHEPFFTAKAKTYLASDIAADKLADRLFEVLRFDLPEQSLFLRDETYRKAAMTGVDLSIGFDKSMTSLKNVISRQISAGKSWDEILTSSDLLFLPTAGQALTEFSQASAAITAKLNDLAVQGVPTTSADDKVVALKIIAGELPAPEGVKVGTGIDTSAGNDPEKALAYAKRAHPILRTWIVAHTTFTKDFDNGLGSVRASKGEDAGLLSYMLSDATSYLSFVLNTNSVLTKIPATEITELKCLMNGIAAKQNRTRPYNDAACAGLGLTSPILTTNVVAWLLQLDLSQPEQSAAAVEYLVKNANTPATFQAILQGADGKEIFSIPSIVSTKDFRERYMKTRYSRAAAFFRTYFCDDMQPVILIDNSTKSADALKGLKFDDMVDARAHEDVMNMITPDVRPEAMKDEGAVTMEQIAESATMNAHFKPECVACHRKLDPAQELIAGKADFSSKPVEVVYDDSDGVEVRVPIKSFSELNQIVVKQERYVRCQSERMWAWTIGEDVSLDASRRAQLTKLYTEAGSKPREIMATLLTRPEFTSDDSFTQPPTFSTVSSLLNRCNSCHAKEEDVPSFTTIPIDGEDHVRWLTKIAKSVNVGNKGVGAKMPKKGANWSLTEADRIALGRWIWNGARDDQGQPTITDADRTKILKNASDEFFSAIAAAREPTPSFRPTWRRYMENFDVLNVLAQKFPAQYTKCATGIDMKMRGTLGFNDKNSGVPTSLTPSVATVDWLNKCFYSVVLEEVGSLGKNGLEGSYERARFYGFDHLANQAEEAGSTLLLWSSVPAETRAKMIARLVDSIIGAYVLSPEDRGDLEKSVNDTLEEIMVDEKDYYATKAMADGAFTILNDERFLAY